MESYVSLLRDYIMFLKGSSGEVAIYVIMIIIILWSGCFSASVAEFRLRSPLFHFFIGVLIPVIYPIFILFKMTVYSAPVAKLEVEEEVIHHIEGPPPVEAAPPASIETTAPVAGLINTESLDSPNRTYDQGYFKQIAIDASGNHRGPFIFIVKGNEFKVEKIIDPMGDAVLIEFVSSDGKLQKLRIPYQNIDSVKEA